MTAELSQSFDAEATVSFPDVAAVVDRVLSQLIAREFSVTRNPAGGEIKFLAGRGVIEVGASGLVMRASAAHEDGLAFMKAMMASHLIEFAEGERPEIVWTGHGADATVYPNFREMTVTHVADITPRMRRVTLSGQNLASFANGGVHLRIYVPPEGVTEPEWPVPGKNGLPVWPAEEKRPKVRTYTIRRIDAAAGTLDVDFVLHGDHGPDDDDHSVGSRWARRAKPGDILGVRGPIGRSLVEADWYLLVGDEAALPAIARHLEARPSSARGVALIEVDNEAERQDIEHESAIEVHWLYRNGAEPGTTTLLYDAVRAVEMPPAGTSVFAFAGVEAEAFKSIRHYWREELKLDKKDILPSSYWRRGEAEAE